MLDVRVRRRADVASDHHLLVDKCCLKFKSYNTGMQKISHKYSTRMLKDDEFNNRFHLTISNKYQVLAHLQKNEEHLEERENQSTVNEMWQGTKNSWKETCEETLGRESKQHLTFFNLDILKMIEARKKVKEMLNHSRTRAKKEEARIRYSEVNREVKRSIRNDQRNFVENLVQQAEEASGRGDVKELCSITRKLTGDRKIPDRSVRDKSRELLTDQEEQRKTWADHFKELLNRPLPSEMHDIQWTLTTRLEDLDFVDDIALLSQNHRRLQSKLTRLEKISMQTGLRIGKSKTKVMRVNTKNADRTELDGDEIEEIPWK